MRYWLFVAGVVAVAFAGCTHAGLLPGRAPALPPSQSQRATAVFVMHWPTPTPQPQYITRKPMYVSPSTKSVTIAVNANTPYVVNEPSPVPSVTTIKIDAPVGTDNFTIKAYGQPNAAGFVLSQTTVTLAIVAGKANVVSAVLQGVVASVALGLSNPIPQAGASTVSTLTVNARDADGNVIVGPGSYSQEIDITDSDSFAMSLSASVIKSPGSVVTLSYNGNSIVSATITATVAGLPPSAVSFAPVPHIYEFPVPTASSGPAGIASGPDGALWFAEENGNKIGRITTGGSFSEFTVPTASSVPVGIASGPDGALWFAEGAGNKIGRITTGGSFSEFTVPTVSSTPHEIVSGPDGALWFTEASLGANNIGRITTGGSFTEFPVPTSSAEPVGIASGPDGALWFTEFNVNKIGRISIGGDFVEFTVTTASSNPQDIASGPDGALWFTEFNGNKIGRITTTGSLSEFTLPSANSAPGGIASGADGALWFAESDGTFANRIGRITTGGRISEFMAPTVGSRPAEITSGPDGALWFTEFNANNIGRLAF